MNRTLFENLERRSYFAITASFAAESGILTVLGDEVANEIVISRDAAGHILVNAGAVPISGGIPTIVNTSKVSVHGMDGADVITMDDTEGALPESDLRGGEGFDTITGGAGFDLILGENGLDSLIGMGGGDLIAGGDGSDTLVGGAGVDTLLGENLNDMFFWNEGDGSDIIDGGAGLDSVQVNGGGDGESFTATANGTRVRFDRLNSVPFFLDIGTTEDLVLLCNDGNDTFSATGNLAALISIDVDGGAGNDTLLGSNGADYLVGGEGNDFIDAQQGADWAFGGDDDDIFQWDPGDGSDTIEGFGGTDSLFFNGSSIGENIQLMASNERLRLTRDIGNILLDCDGLERINVNALGGADSITVHTMASTSVTQVNVNLAGTLGGSSGDAQIDTVFVNGTQDADSIELIGAVGGGVSVTGLAATVTVNTIEAANDRLVVNSLAGNDLIDASAIGAIFAGMTLDGGMNNDTLIGSNGFDVLLGGFGDDLAQGNVGADLALMGDGNDIFVWNASDGSDTVEGQLDSDTLLINGNNSAESYDLSVVADRMRMTRNVTGHVVDGDGIDIVDINLRGGADSVTIPNMTGTDVRTINLNLESAPGSGDGTEDSISVSNTDFNDNLFIDDTATGVKAYGLFATVNINGCEAHDTLTARSRDGNDNINAERVSAGRINLVLDGGLGNDTLTGGDGSDRIIGGDGFDQAFMGAGDDTFVWNPDDDNDTVNGEAGDDTLIFNGSNISENIVLASNGGGMQLFRSSPNSTLDCDGIDVVDINLTGGTDFVTVNDQATTDVRQVNINLTTDTQLDNVFINGSANSDSIQVGADNGAMSVSGLAATVNLMNVEPTNDLITLRPLGGADNVTINHMTGFDATPLRINLEANPTFNEPDLQSDSVTIRGHDSSDTVMVSDVTSGTQVTGLGPKVLIMNADETIDSMTISTMAGADSITVNQLASIGSVRQVYIDAGADTDTINALGNDLTGAVRIMPSAGDDAVSVNADGVFTTNVVFEGTQRIGSLTVGTGGLAMLPAGGDKVLTVTSLSMSGGRIDVADNDMILDYTGGSPIATIQSLIGSAYVGGAWAGFGITTTMGNATTHALGYAEASDVAPGGVFSGHSLDSTAVVIKFTYYGDADLSGTVDVADLGRLASNWQLSPRRWSQGNFNYDGVVDVADLGMLASNWQAGAGAPLAASRMMPRIADSVLR
jgi:Ca2+-binding RTX toxin-like protein